jgi:hypothetical protein
MSERLPLLHIVGTPSTKLVANKALLHHTLGEGKLSELALTAAMSAQISAHTLQLSRSEGAGQLIDELIKVAIRECRPGSSSWSPSFTHLKIIQLTTSRSLISLPHPSYRPHPRQDLLLSPQPIPSRPQLCRAPNPLARLQAHGRCRGCSRQDCQGLRGVR